MKKMVYGALETSLKFKNMKNKIISKYYYCDACNNIMYREEWTKDSYCIATNKKVLLKEVKDFEVVEIFKQLKKLSNANLETLEK